MSKKVHPDIEILQTVAQALGPLKDRVVFVGGATVTLYIDDLGSPESVATEDVDCVVELSGTLSYPNLERQLHGLGFKQPVEEPNAPICRWKVNGILVDVMPSDPKILGFSNRWYPEGVANRETARLPDQTVIFIFGLAYFVASKLEAFKGRGGKDPRFSHDLEDMLLVLSGNSRALEKLLAAHSKLRKYLVREFKSLLKNPLLPEAVSGALIERGEPGGRVTRVIDLIKQISQV